MKYLFFPLFFLTLSFGLKAQRAIDAKPTSKSKDSIPTIITIYHPDDNLLNVRAQNVDTALTDFQEYYPFYKKNFSDLFLGNYGLAYFDQIFEAIPYSDFIFMHHIKDYWYIPDSVDYYNTTKPYTKLTFLTGPKLDKENIVSFMHARNINPFWNVTLKVEANSAQGSYNSQMSRGSSVYFTSNYQKKNLGFYAYSIFNKLNNQENGGIIDTIELIGTQIPVKMANTYNLFKQKEYGEHLIYTIPYNIRKQETTQKDGKDTIIEKIERKDLLTIGQNFKYSPITKIYKDKDIPINVYNAYFAYDSIASYDSTNQTNWQANFYLKTGDDLLPYVKIGAFAEYKMAHTKLYNFKEYVRLKNDTAFEDRSFRFGLFNQSGKILNWQFSYEMFTSGYHKSDYTAKAFAQLRLFEKKFPLILAANAQSKLSEPSYWFNRYSANRIAWENNFDKIYMNQATASVTLQKLHTKISATAGQVQNYIYFNTRAKPAQTKNTIAYLKTGILNIINLKYFALESKFLYQSFSDSIIHLPQLTYRGSFYYKGYTLSKAMYNQIGFEVFFQSAYKTPYFMPATETFYLQNDSVYNHLPLVNFYVSAQMRRSRFFLKWMNINYLITKEKFFEIPKYPLTDTYFRFGVSWRFYD